VQSFNASADFSGAQLQVGTTVTALPSSMQHRRPEIDLINPSTGINAINGGNITVASNWNLGAQGGPAGNLVNASSFTDLNGKVIQPGTVITDANGALLSADANYAGALNFLAGTSSFTPLYRTNTGRQGNLVNTIAFTDTNGHTVPPGTVVTDANGVLLPA